MGKNDIEITIENCRNISCINNNPLLIAKNRLNVFFAANGTGKTTICRALEYHNNPCTETFEALRSHSICVGGKKKGSHQNPVIDVKHFNGKALIFNEAWIGQHCFVESDLHANAFEVYFRSKAVEKQEKKITGFLRGLNALVSSEDFDALYKNAESIKNKLGSLNQSGEFSGNSRFVRAYSNGAPVGNGIPNRLIPVVRGLSFGEQSCWIKWHITRPTLKSPHLCPYCGANDKTAMGECRQYDDAKKKGSVSSWAGLAEMFEEKKDLLAVPYRSVMRAVLSSRTYPTPNQKKQLESISREAEGICKALEVIRDAANLKVDDSKLLSELKNACAVLRGSKLFLKSHNGKQTETWKTILGLIRAVDRVDKNQTALKTAITDLKNEVGKRVKDRKGELDAFLKACGYPYLVKVETDPLTGDAHLLLFPNGANSNKVEDPGSCLSYGEKNALSLALFLFEALSRAKNRTLLILDDPISSFDFDKRYGILHSLFADPNKSCFSNNLCGFTTLVLTHDHLVLNDLIAMPGAGLKGKVPRGNFLKTDKNGILHVEPFSSNSILPYIQLVRKKISNSTGAPEVLRLMHVRQLCEMNRKRPGDLRTKEGITFELLSHIIHGRQENSIKSLYANKGYKTSRLVKVCEGYVSHLLKTKFDYWQSVRQNTGNIPQLVSFYKNGSPSPEEKLMLVRLMFERDSTIGQHEKSMTRFADEACHIGGSYLYQLDPTRCNQIPFYVTEWCDTIVGEVESKYVGAVAVCPPHARPLP